MSWKTALLLGLVILVAAGVSSCQGSGTEELAGVTGPQPEPEVDGDVVAKASAESESIVRVGPRTEPEPDCGASDLCIAGYVAEGLAPTCEFEDQRYVLEGVPVTLQVQDGNPITKTTGPDGTYAFTDLPGYGEYAVTVPEKVKLDDCQKLELACSTGAAWLDRIAVSLSADQATSKANNFGYAMTD